MFYIYSEQVFERQRSTRILNQIDKCHSPKLDDCEIAPAEMEDLGEADFDDLDESTLALHSEYWPKEGRRGVTDTSQITQGDSNPDKTTCLGRMA